jgi:hypothetical protein
MGNDTYCRACKNDNPPRAISNSPHYGHVAEYMDASGRVRICRCPKCNPPKRANITASTRGGLTFRQWKRDVNRELQRICGLSADDLADCDYWSYWNDGMSAADAATEVLAENDFPFDTTDTGYGGPDFD